MNESIKPLTCAEIIALAEKEEKSAYVILNRICHMHEEVAKALVRHIANATMLRMAEAQQSATEGLTSPTICVG